MDILSDVNLVGNLSVSRKSKFIGHAEFCSSTCFYYSTYFKVFSFNILSGSDCKDHSCLCVNTRSHFFDDVVFHEPVKFVRESVSGNSSEFYYQTEVSVTVPAGCKRFHIHELNVETWSDMNSSFFEDTDNLIHPLVTAWCGGKKIEMDLELGYCYIEGRYGFTELLIGNVNSSDTNRKINVVLR